jgi:DNA-directed RNA polymerase specialized sigma24 family protein
VVSVAVGGSPDPDQFAGAASRLVAVLSTGSPDEISRDDLAIVVAWLGHWLVRRYQLTESDAEEVVVGAVERLFELRVSTPEAERTEIENPVGYLVTMARHRAIDRLRRARAASERDEVLRRESMPTVTDDDIAALLDRQSTVHEIQTAIRAAVEAGDDLTVRVVAAWLNLAAELGVEPVSREVAAAAGVSHTSVNQALRRFRTYFPRGVSAAS